MRPSFRFLALATLVAGLALAPVLATSAARAADAVTVPDVSGLVWQDAVTALTGVGLAAHAAGDGLVNPQVSTVADQCPRAGAAVAPGSTVTLTVKTTIPDCATGGSGGGQPAAVAIWPLDEASGTTARDATGTGHDGTYAGAVTLGGSGAPQNGNAAATFSGGDVTVPYSADLNPGTYTVEAWVNPSAVNTWEDQGTAAQPIVCSRDDQGYHGWMLYADNYTGNPQFAFVVGAEDSRRYVYDDSGTPEQPGRWYHVAGSYDGTDLHIYVNGVEVTSAQLNDGGGTNVQPNPSSPLTIGSCNGGWNPWQGAIQDVTVWNGALSAATIAQHASAGTPPPGSGGGGGSGGGCGTQGCPDTQKPTVPLVFLPGITGSRLDSCDSGLNVWPNAVVDPLMVPLLALDSNVCLQATSVLPSYLSLHFYDQTIDALTRLGGYEDGKTLFPCPFDWRLSAAEAQAAADSCVSNALAVSGASQVDVLAHSQGGLVASMLVLHSQGKVRRLVTAGTPVLGAEKALDLLEWAHECIVGKKILWGVLCFPPVDKADVQKALGTMPGYFELLPSPAYASAVAPPLLLPGKSANAYSTLENYVGQRYAGSMLDNASALHRAALDDFTPPVPMLRIVGNNQSTLVQVKVTSQKVCFNGIYYWCYTQTHTDFIESKAGDGTVPLNSADLKNDRTGFDHRNGVPNRYFSHTHMGLVQSDDSIQAAIAFFRAPTAPARRVASATASASPPGSVVLPSGMPGSDTPTPTTPSIQIEVFGGASTTVESLAGGTLGSDADSVDGGSYGHVDGTDSFTLDTPGTFTATVQPSDGSPLLVLVRRYSDVVEQQSLFSVPAPVPGQALTLPLTTDQDLGDLRLDDGGTELTPVATTNGNAVEDATPPTTVAGGSVSTWGKATATLLAQDDSGGAGVAATYVQPAGAAAPVRYTQPFQVPLFSSLHFWSVDRAGNTEDTHTIVVDDTPDVRQLATPLTAGRPLARTIWPAGDEDWFRFTADGSSLVSAQLDGLLAHFDLELYDAAGNLLQAPHAHPFSSEEIRGVLPSGTYYLRVTGQAHLLLPYSLELRLLRR